MGLRAAGAVLGYLRVDMLAAAQREEQLATHAL